MREGGRGWRDGKGETERENVREGESKGRREGGREVEIEKNEWMNE